MFRKLLLFSVGIVVGAGTAFALSGCQDRLNFNPMTAPVTSEVAPVDTGN